MDPGPNLKTQELSIPVENSSRVASRNFVTGCLTEDVTGGDRWIAIGPCHVVRRKIAVLGDELLKFSLHDDSLGVRTP